MTVSSGDDLQRLIDFVNTRDIEEATEALDRPAALTTWLSDRALLGPGTRASAGDLTDAVALREALRAVLLAHNGAADPAPEVAATIDRVAERGRLSVCFGEAGATVAPRVPGVAGALAALLAPIPAASADGRWARVKACPADDCRWAFYDRSRNRTGRWCDMAVCGNRTKVRSYRSRAGDG